MPELRLLLMVVVPMSLLIFISPLILLKIPLTIGNHRPIIIYLLLIIIIHHIPILIIPPSTHLIPPFPTIILGTLISHQKLVGVLVKIML